MPGKPTVTGMKTGTAGKGVSYRVADKNHLLKGKRLAVLAKAPEKNSRCVTGRGIQKGQTAGQADPDGTQAQADYGEEARDSINKENAVYARCQKIKARKGKGIIKKSAVLKMAGAVASQAALEQMEGGKETRDSVMAAAALAAPALDAAKAGKRLCQKETPKKEA